MTGFTVSQAARRAQVTVRTLHHYDEIGLLVPSDRSRAGYRLYSEADLARLHQILLFRELGFSLEAIADLLDESPAVRRDALRLQRERLIAQRRRTDAVLRALDATLDSLETETAMRDETMFDGFDEFESAPHAEEARQRWGHTDAYAESRRRVRAYGKADWEAIKAESGANLAAFCALFDAGDPPDGAAAMDRAEDARLQIDRWFYPCSHAMHALLAEGYVSDPRFTAFYDRLRPGLAAFVAAAIRANEARGGRP